MKHDIIHCFIKRLDQGELRVCEHHLSQTKSDVMPTRKRLFDAMLGQQEYDREALIAAVGDKWSKERLSKEKQKLYDDLIEVVGRLHRERDNRQCPWTQWQEARTLLRMGLLEAAAVTAQKGLDVAMHLEDVFAEMQLRELLRETLKGTDRKAAQAQIVDNNQRLDTAVDKVRTLVTYSLIADQLIDYYQRFRTIDPAKQPIAIDTLLRHDSLSDSNKATSLPALLRFHHIKVLQARMQGQTNETLAHYWEIVRLWETHPQYINQRPDLYRKALANLIGMLIVANNHWQVEVLLARMDAIPVVYQRDRALQFCDVELQHQFYYLNSGRLDAALKRKDLLPKGLKDHGKTIADAYQIALRYNAGVMHMMNDDARPAKKMFNEIRELKHIADCRDLQGLARLCRLLLLMAEHEPDFDNYLRRNRPFFSPTDALYAMEQMVYDWVAAHRKCTTDGEERKSFAALTAQLVLLEEAKLVGAEELRIWAQAHANGLSVREVYLAHHAASLAASHTA